MKNLKNILFAFICLLIGSCSNSKKNNESESAQYALEDTTAIIPDSIIEEEVTPVASSKVVEKIKIEVPRFSIIKREREDYNDYTPRTRYYVRIPKTYSEDELDLIADSLLDKEREEHQIREIWVSYFLPKKKVDFSNSYALSMRLRNERRTNIHQEVKRKLGYNPPKPRDLSNATLRQSQLWGAFDRGQIAGYEAGYNDGKRRRKAGYSFDSEYPTSDEWIEQSYKQGYEVGYLNGFDDAGGER